MRKVSILTILFIMAVVVYGCSKEMSKMPDADSANVWNYVQSKDYTDWDYFPGTTDMYPGQSPHGAFLTSYINKKASDSIDENGFTNGSIIVKENYTPKKKLAAVTVMYKIDGFNPEAGDWYWAKYTPEGKAQAAGKVKPCIQCHSAAKDADWSFLKKNM